MSGQPTNPWARQLGLIATPLFGHERPVAGHNHLALLDGVRASFLLSTDMEDDDTALAPDWAWSSNVHHHVAVKQSSIVVSRSSGSRETFDRNSVESKLSEFLRYLELDTDSNQISSAVDHLVRVFRKHRTTLQATSKNEIPDLESFLYLLAITQEPSAISAHRQGRAIADKYCLSSFDPTLLDDNYISRFVEELTMDAKSARHLLTPLTIRHAGGVLFQEAHAEVLSGPLQMTLFGLSDAAHQKLDLSRGVYYTPPGLARTLTEIAIEPHLGRDVIRIHDPACGSGIFLCEAIRVLQRKGYQGRIVLAGRDISDPAVQMARFSIACALLDWPNHRVQWQIEAASFFDAFVARREFDVVLMNPPFLSWQALSDDQKALVKDVIGESFAGRPDLSTAFIQESLGQLSDGGTLATLIPRGVLDSQQGSEWRKSLLSRNDVRLIGTFGNHGLFRHAMVSISAAVFERKRVDASTVMVWADERVNSADVALRELRRDPFENSSLRARSNNWSIYSINRSDLLARKSWLPTPNALGRLLDLIKARDLPTVVQTFTVRQGIKTGLNQAFVISQDELRKLPKSEHKFFRLVANGDDIIGGRVRSSTYIFYVPDLFTSKKQLLEKAPTFGRSLLQYEAVLKKRPKSKPDRWWEPVWPRKDLASRTPRILTKMFGATDMAAVDYAGDFLPLQAFSWMPTWFKPVDPELREAALLWYCRILNSRIFFLLRREFAAAITAGGQLDVSPRYVGDVPLPHPTSEELMRIASSTPNVSASKENDELVAAAYGTDIKSWPIYETD